jgi:prepilin-type N-terminal cleavage/methylation domain-containing protein
MSSLQYRLQGSKKFEAYLANPKSTSEMQAERSGFTVIEILIVTVIIVIAAMMVMPMMGSSASMQLRSAANIIAADLEYAKSMAISRQKIYAVIFNEATESYQIEDPDGIINHPVKKGFQYIVNFSNDSRLDMVDIFDADFDGTNEIKFDYLGSPYNGNDTNLNNGLITLRARDMSTTITIEPVTGFITISD